MTDSQEKALNWVRNYIVNSGTDKFPVEIKEEKVDTVFSEWVNFYIYYGNKNDEDNGLRLNRESIGGKIGKRGKITLWTYPKSFNQFAGSTFLRRFHIQKNGAQ